MADRYYSNTDEGQRFQPGSTAEAGQVDQKFDEVTAGFQEVAGDTDRSLKLPAVTGTTQEIDATPLQRRRKVVGFDADGNLTLLDGFVWRGDWAATTEYFVNDVVVDPETLNWHIATTRHTSGATFTTTNWHLALDYAAVKALLRSEVGQTLTDDLQPLVTSASGSAQAAGESEAKAQEWAEAEGEVEPGQRSAKYWAGQAEEVAAGNLPITSLKPGTLTAPKDYVSVDAQGALVRRNLAADVSAQLTAGNESAKLSRYDLASVSITATLDLATSNVFRVDASVARTLAFANAPGAGRAMTVVVHISGNSAVTWPAGIDWDSDAAPELGDTETKVVMFWDGVEWSGFVRVAK